jgi:hypothetical protein
MTARDINRSNHKRRDKGNKAAGIVIFSIILPLLLVYFYFVFYYHNHFFNNTVINGVSTTNMKVSAAEDAINAQVRKYSLTINGRNEITDLITGDDIDFHSVFGNSISDLLKEQNEFAWPASFFKANKLEVDTMFEYDEALLKEKFNKLAFFNEENIVEPVDASISEYGKNGYEIIPEEQGAKIIVDKLYEAVVNSVNALETSLSVEEAGCYEEPKITSETSKLVKALNKLNKLTSTKLTYEFGEDTEILDGEMISKWLWVDDKFKVHLETDGVKEFVDYIGKNYNSFGKTRTFKTSYGDVITVKGGDYGWWLNRPAEVEELLELIQNGAKQVKEPVYFQTAQQYGKDDVGDTYVEVNLTAQHLFFYKDGKLILESDFVSGNVSKDYGTPTGTYPVQYKDKDATLVGEDYETPVKYWMPFNKNIGFHDASWRDEFGKDIYLTKGSHGCVNMPPAKAKKMFENIQRGVAVVVYKLPGTENYEKENTDKTKS